MFWLTRHGKKVQFSSAWEKLCWSQHLENGRNFNCNSHDIICITTRSRYAAARYSNKKCRKRKEKKNLFWLPPLERISIFTHAAAAPSDLRVWKIIVRSSQLTWSENRCPFLATNEKFFFSFLPTRKAPGKVPWNWLALVSRLHDTSILCSRSKKKNHQF